MNVFDQNPAPCFNCLFHVLGRDIQVLFGTHRNFLKSLALVISQRPHFGRNVKSLSRENQYRIFRLHEVNHCVLQAPVEILQSQNLFGQVVKKINGFSLVEYFEEDTF